MAGDKDKLGRVDGDPNKPGSSHRGTRLQSWTPQTMHTALTVYFTQFLPSFRGKRRGYKSIADEYGIPRETFRRRTKMPFQGITDHIAGGRGLPRVFSIQQESELAAHILRFAEAGFPFTPLEIRQLAFEFAVDQGALGFSNNTNEAGMKWFKGFLMRYPQLSIKTPKLLAVYRAKCASKVVIDGWFEIFKDVLERFQIQGPSFIWNVDECGCIDQPKTKKVVVEKGKKANQMASSEQGETTTAVVFASASGLHIPPMIIHKGGKIMDAWRTEMRWGTMIAASENGWITKKLFYFYGQLFLKHLREWGLLDGERKHILLLDSHKSHLFNIQFMKLMRDNGIQVLAIPAHTSHILQPLDDAPFANFKMAWYEAVRLHVRETGAKKLPKSQFFRLFNQAWDLGMTVRNIRGGFEHTGIYPFNRGAITDEKMAPSSHLNEEASKNEYIYIYYSKVGLLIHFFFVSMLVHCGGALNIIGI